MFFCEFQFTSVYFPFCELFPILFSFSFTSVFFAAFSSSLSRWMSCQVSPSCGPRVMFSLQLQLGVYHVGIMCQSKEVLNTSPHSTAELVIAHPDGQVLPHSVGTRAHLKYPAFLLGGAYAVSRVHLTAVGPLGRSHEPGWGQGQGTLRSHSQQQMVCSQI